MIIRIDDYPHGDLINYNRLIADSNYDHREHVYHFLQPFERRGIPYVLGVSPGLINPESDLFFLQTLRYCEVAMHGFSHGWHEFADTWHKITETWPKGGEFAFDSKETIRDKIKRGLDILGPFKIRKFIPPFNAYTQDLLDILNEFGFEMIMGGRQTIQFHMDELDHGDLHLDICVPPLCNDSDKILPHLEQAIRDEKTILLHWIFEQPTNVSYWERISEVVQQSEAHDIRYSKTLDHQSINNIKVDTWSHPHPPQPLLEKPLASNDSDRIQDKRLNGDPPLISAIVSTYNSEKFIKGCLEDLEAQSMARRLEIIVVDSGSQQNERGVVEAFQRQYDNIVYIRTENRESVYAAWNRGIKASRGVYITNANTDDRHRKDALERMVEVLDARPDIALVYADVIITEHGNETFDQCTPSDFYHWLDWDRRHLMEKDSFIGPQPMWRRTLHDEYGYFDESFKTSGDYEFWLRSSQTNDFLRIPVLLGLYLESPNSIEHRHKAEKQEENKRLLEMYQKAAMNGDIIRRFYTNDEKNLLDVHNAKAEELFNKGDIDAAKIIFNQILAKNPNLLSPTNNLGVIAFQENALDEAVSWFERAFAIDPGYFEAMENLGKCMETKGDFKSAMEWFRRALVLQPDEIGMLNALGNTLVQTENISEAKEVYKRSLQLNDHQSDIEIILKEISQLEGSLNRDRQANCNQPITPT